MAKNEAKIKFTAETGEYNDQIKKASAEMAKLRAELKLNEAQMEATGVSVEGLETKHRILADQLSESEKKTEALAQKVELAKDIFGEHSQEVVKLQTQLANAQAAEEKLRQAVNVCNEELEEQKAAAAKVETASEKLTNTIQKQQAALDDLKDQYKDACLEYGDTSDEAQKLAREIRELSEELQQNKNRMDDATAKADKLDRSLDDVGDSAEDTADSFGVLDGAASILVAGGIAALVGGLSDAASSLADLADETREYREDLGKLETSFEDAGHTAAEGTEVYKELYSVFGEEDRAVEAAQQIAKLADNQAEMTRMTTIATGAWAMWGDSLATESLMEAVNSTAKIGEVQGTLADALEWCGINLKEFNADLAVKTTEEERSAYILDTLEGLYSKAAVTYRKNNKTIIESRKATSDYNDTLAEMGEILEPLDTRVTELKNNFAKEFAPVLEDEIVPALDDFMDRLEDSGAIEDAADMLGDLTETILPPLADMLGFVTENWEFMAIGIGGTVTALKTFQIINTVSTGIKGATSAMGAFNAVMAANPIGAVVTALGGLAALCIGFSALLGDTKTELDYVAEALEDNTEKNREWQEVLDNATVSIGDWSNFANAAGDTAYSLTSKMEEAQNKITQIWATANAENRALRDEEIAAIKQYNLDYVNALNELAALQEQKLQAQMDMLQYRLEHEELTQEEYQGVLNKIEEVETAHAETMEELVNTELVTLRMRLTNGQITQAEFDTLYDQTLARQTTYADRTKEITQGVVEADLEALRKSIDICKDDYANRVHYYTSTDEIATRYTENLKRIQADETLSWAEKNRAEQALYDEMRSNFRKFQAGQQVSWTDYNFLTDAEIQKNTQSFFNWVGECKEAGVQLSEENRQTYLAILNAYASLPEDLQEAGFESLQGLAVGMASQYPEVEAAAEEDMNHLIAAMWRALGVASPSTKMITAGHYVMDGLSTGMNDKLPDVRNVVTAIGDSIIATFKKKMDINSPSGVAEELMGFVMDGLIGGVGQGTEPLLDAVDEQLTSLMDAYQAGGAMNGFDVNPGSLQVNHAGGDFTETLAVQIARQDSVLAAQFEQTGREIVDTISRMSVTLDGRTVGKLIYDQVGRNMARADAVRGGGF